MVPPEVTREGEGTEVGVEAVEAVEVMAAVAALLEVTMDWCSRARPHTDPCAALPRTECRQQSVPSRRMS
jgi:hypothetical protein